LNEIADAGCVAGYRFTGIETSPNEIVPVPIERGAIPWL
jgi:hypothetical protein